MDKFTTKDIITITASKKSKLVYSIMAIFLIPLFLTLVFLPFIDQKQRGIIADLILVVMGLAGSIFFLFLFLSLLKGKIEFHNDRIVEKDLFKQKTILYTDILGYRILNESGILLLKIFSKDDRKIEIEIKYFESNKELLDRFCKTFNDLDEIDIEKEKKEIIENAEFGLNENERIQKLEQAKKASKILNRFGIVAGLWAMIWPQPYRVAIWTMLILPFLAYSIIRYYKGLIKYDDVGGKLYPNVAAAIIMPCPVLILRGFSDWNIYEWKYFWLPFILISLLLFVYAYVSAKEIKTKIGFVIGILLFCFMYGYGATISLNGLYSSKEKNIYYAEILDKRISKGNPTTYYFKLKPWEMNDEEDEERVNKEVYDKYKNGDKVKIIMRNGLFKIIWYDIE